MAKGIKRRLKLAVDEGRRQMAENGGGLYARGLSSEGYLGGYVDALNDVCLLLNGVEPNDRRAIFKKSKPPNA